MFQRSTHMNIIESISNNINIKLIKDTKYMGVIVQQL